MKKTMKLSRLAVQVMLLTGTFQAVAQTNESPQNIEVISVKGVRASAVTSVNTKQESVQVVDAITSEELGKFPDTNIAESLQRVPGIQVSRSRGEASGISIRGLDEVATLLNGRNYFGGSADTSINRFASFEDIPAELVGSVEVFKSVSADLVEGGIGGVVNIRRTDALSLNDFSFAGSVKVHHGDLSDEWSPRGSLVIGDSWGFGNEGEVGVIFGASYVKRAFREDLVRNSNFADVGGEYPSGNVPQGSLVTTSLNSSPAWGERERSVYTLGVDLQTSDETRFFFDGGYTEFTTEQFREEFVWGFNAANVTDATNIDGSRYAAAVTFSDMTFDVLNMIDSRDTITFDLAVGFEHVADDWELSGEVSYVDTDNDTAFRNSRIRDNSDSLIAIVDQSEFPHTPPSVSFSNFDYTNIDNFNIVQWRHESRQLTADETAARTDLKYYLDDSWLTSVESGLRFANVDTLKNIQNNHVFDASGSTYGNDDPLGLIGESRWGDFMNEWPGAQFPSSYLAIDPTQLKTRDKEIRQQYGLPAQSAIANPRDFFDYSESVASMYVKGNLYFLINDVEIQGNAGVRYVRTDTTADYFFNTGNSDENGMAIYEGQTDKGNYNELLPSINLRAALTDEVVLRFAASRTLARPAFGDMAPSLNLNFEQGRGVGGNPGLKPFTAENYDLSLEYYFDEGNILSSTLFYKNVDGFLQTSESPENIGGQDFIILRKSNGGSGKIKGIEVGYQQFFTTLPEPFDALGVQANYTYVSSDVPSPNPELPNISLEGLSDKSYNLVLIYETDLLSARIAYNHRSDFLVTTEYTQEGFGQLDASFSYSVNDSLKLTLDALNLLRREHFEYRAGSSDNPYHWIATERQVLAGVSYSF